MCLKNGENNDGGIHPLDISVPLSCASASHSHSAVLFFFQKFQILPIYFLLCLLISRHVCSKFFEPRRLNCRVFCIFLNALKFAFASPSHSFPFILLVPPGVFKCFSGVGALSILTANFLSCLGETSDKIFFRARMETDPPAPNPSAGAEVCE